MSDVPGKKKRLTAEQKKVRAEYAEREARTKEWMSEQVSRTNKLRSKDTEFHGLEREFLNFQAEMLHDYEVSKDIKHPRDVGTIREVLLREFFLKNKLLPKRYAISEASVRIASRSGHLSNEIDIAFYDAIDSFTLMQRQEVFEVLPIEYCHGIIQVKSKLTKEELKKAFSNVQSFKRLQRMGASPTAHNSQNDKTQYKGCLLYTSPSPRDS